MDLFVTCAQYLEPLLAQELALMGYSQAVTGYRGVNIRNVNLEDVYRINYSTRLGGRVLVQLLNFRCYDSKSLYTHAAKIRWEEFFASNQTFAIDANVKHPRLRNSLFAAQVVKDAICDQLKKRTGERPNVDTKDPDIQLNLFINDQYASLSFDTSGAALHKRGYRQEAVEAPLQETLAAGLLTLAGFAGHEVLLDPCCGSGTILIEAALIASSIPPGFLRKKWGFMQLPNFSQSAWLRVKAEADSKKKTIQDHHFFGIDISKQAIHATKVNLRAAGLHQSVEVVQGDVRDFEPSIQPNFIITNPPYGRRLDNMDQLSTLYRALGDFMKRKASKPARGFVFTGSIELSKQVGLAPSKRHVLDNGGVDSRLLEFDLY